MTTAPDPHNPSNCACFNIRRAARRITQAYDRSLQGSGLQATQFTLLAMLRAAEGKDGIVVSELANRLGMDRTTLTRNLAVVTRSEWVEVLPGADRRERLIKLTEHGRKKLEQATPAWREAQDKVTAALGEDGFNELLRLARSLDPA